MVGKKNILGSGLGILLVLCIGGFLSVAFAQTNAPLELSYIVRSQIQANGFVTSRPMPFWGTIAGTKELAVDLTQGEICFLQMMPGKEIKPGDRWAVSRLGNSVIHPVTHKVLGRHIIFPGELIVLETKGSMATAKVEKSFRTINVGDMVLPPQQTIPSSVTTRSPKDIEGIVLLSAEREVDITSNVVIFIDKGSQDGVIAGDRFSIYRSGYFPKEFLDRQQGNLPLIKVGEAVAITVQEEATTALVTKSSSSINIGFRVVSGGE